ncbi:MAG: SDR family oxidoreductase [Variovorax sp.]|nr:MAG: SDR family oxidoreductase [Variovorax sp.]
MKIVVIGGNGLIGSKLIALLQQRGHEAIAASPSTGVNTLTGEGLAAALAGAQVVVDVANSPSFEDKAVMSFFETSGRNLLAAEAVAGVQHHVALSVVGTERLQGSGYFRAKLVQERLIEASKIPYTIVRATQFMEFLAAIAQSGTEGQTVRLPSAHLQPIAAQDVALAMADAALGEPVNGMVEVGGPERAGMAAMVERYLRASGDARTVVADAQAPYFGVAIDDSSLTTRTDARLGATTLDAWLAAR